MASGDPEDHLDPRLFENPGDERARRHFLGQHLFDRHRLVLPPRMITKLASSKVGTQRFAPSRVRGRERAGVVPHLPARLSLCAGNRGTDDGFARGLCDRRGWIGWLCRRRSSERGRRAGRSARGRADRLAPDDPRARRGAAPAGQSARQLELLRRACGEHRQPVIALAARQGAGRHQLDQRHALCARQSGRL